MKICDEMLKLREALDNRGIEWKDESTICTQQMIDDMVKTGIAKKYADSTMYRTHFWHKGWFYSVIHGRGSYGGVHILSGYDAGLLECKCDKVNGGEPLGYLTADDVINIIDDKFQVSDKF